MSVSNTISSFLKDRKTPRNEGNILLTIGLDPSTTSYGYAVIGKSTQGEQLYLIHTENLVPLGRTVTEKLKHIYLKTLLLIQEIDGAVNYHNSQGYKTFSSVELLGAGLEIPNFFSGGKLTIKTDLKHRESIAATRIACAMQNIRLLGDSDDTAIAPSDFQKEAEATKRGLTPEHRKQIVAEWVFRNTILFGEEKPKTLDETDAAAIGIIALRRFLNERI